MRLRQYPNSISAARTSSSPATTARNHAGRACAGDVELVVIQEKDARGWAAELLDDMLEDIEIGLEHADQMRGKALSK